MCEILNSDGDAKVQWSHLCPKVGGAKVQWFSVMLDAQVWWSCKKSDWKNVRFVTSRYVDIKILMSTVIIMEANK